MKYLRWGMFGFCCGVVAGMWGWGIFDLVTDPWLGKRMLPMAILLSLPTAAMGVFWLVRAKESK